MSRPRRAGYAYRQARKELLSRGEIQQCWSCGKELHRDLPKGHPNAITLGHYTAIEDGGAMTDPTNYGPQCERCNKADGGRRTQRKLRHRRMVANVKHTGTYTNPTWE